MRVRCLAPFLAEIQLWVGQTCGNPMDIPHFAEVAWHRMELGQWERTVLKNFAEVGDPHDRALNQVTDGVAYQIKCSQLLDVFEHGPMPAPAELPEFLDELITFMAIGLALQHGLQWEVNRCIASAGTLEANSITGFRDRIVRCVDELKERVGAEQFEQATQRAHSLATNDSEKEAEPVSFAAEVTQKDLHEEEPAGPTWASYGTKPEADVLPPWLSKDIPLPASTPVTPGPRPDRSRIKPLATLLVCVVAIYGVMLLNQPVELRQPILTKDDFSHVSPIQTIKARPPSLYVTVDEQWDALPSDERQKVLEQIGRVAEVAGYSGAVVRGSDRVTVGEWMRNTGAAQIDPPAGVF